MSSFSFSLVSLVFLVCKLFSISSNNYLHNPGCSVSCMLVVGTVAELLSVPVNYHN